MKNRTISVSSSVMVTAVFIGHAEPVPASKHLL